MSPDNGIDLADTAADAPSHDRPRARGRDVLTDTEIREAKPKDRPYKLSDGGGLYLLINPNASKWWRLNSGTEERSEQIRDHGQRACLNDIRRNRQTPL